jgi:hypothetical protein
VLVVDEHLQRGARDTGDVVHGLRLQASPVEGGTERAEGIAQVTYVRQRDGADVVDLATDFDGRRKVLVDGAEKSA